LDVFIIFITDKLYISDEESTEIEVFKYMIHESEINCKSIAIGINGQHTHILNLLKDIGNNKGIVHDLHL